MLNKEDLVKQLEEVKTLLKNCKDVEDLRTLTREKNDLLECLEEIERMEIEKKEERKKALIIERERYWQEKNKLLVNAKEKFEAKAKKMIKELLEIEQKYISDVRELLEKQDEEIQYKEYGYPIWLYHENELKIKNIKELEKELCR